MCGLMLLLLLRVPGACGRAGRLQPAARGGSAAAAAAGLGGPVGATDDMSGCRTLEELRGVVAARLGVWERRRDIGCLRAAFHLTGKGAHGAGVPGTGRVQHTVGVRETGVPGPGPATAAGGSGGGYSRAGHYRPGPEQQPVGAGGAGLHRARVRPAVAALCGELLRRLRAEESATASAAAIATAGAAAAVFNQQELSNVLWACAKLGHRDPDLLQPLADAAAAAVASMTGQGLSNCLWALATLGCAGPEYRAAVGALAREAAVDARGMSMQALSNSLWALAALGYCGPECRPAVAGLCGEVRRRLLAAEAEATAVEVGSQQQISNVLWACAKLEVRDTGLLQPLAAAAATAVPGMTGQGLSNSLWALAALGCTGPEYRTAALDLGRPQAGLVAALAAEGRRQRFAGFGPQELSNSAWALAKLGFGGAAAAGAVAVGPEAPEEQRRWFAGAVEAALPGVAPGAMEGAAPQAWSNLLYALALVRHQPPPELLGAAGGAAAALARGGAQDCASVLYAMAVLRRRHAGVEAAGDPGAVDGPTALRNTQLTRVFGPGRVLCVPYWDWYDLSGPQQEAYLLRLLQPLLKT
eukprot:XP_001700618.1 predicted protein of CLR family [Chlamydomonas reinhardtii]